MLRDKLNSMILILAFLAFAVKGLPPSILWYPIRLFTVWNRFNYMILYQYLLWQIRLFFIIAVSDSSIYDFSTYLEDGSPHLSLQIIGHWSGSTSGIPYLFTWLPLWLEAGSVGWIFSGDFLGGGHFFPWRFSLGGGCGTYDLAAACRSGEGPMGMMIVEVVFFQMFQELYR